jgi:NAD(P)-dependent dehydrogenase (short-subunit alcohol dehydrogenase family)
MARLEGRVCIVTGAAQGLGAAYARAMAGEGAKVVVTDINDCAPVAAEIESIYQGAEVLALRTDVTDEAAVEDMVAKTLERFGKLDVLVSNAAVFADIEFKPIDDIPVEEWNRVMAVNIRGPFLCAKAALKPMRAQKYGKIINISSGTVFRGTPGLLHYVASKGAMLAMTRSLSREVGGDNICVNTIAPGLTESEGVLSHGGMVEGTEMGDMIIGSRALKRAQVPEDLTGTVIFLASAESDFITGQCIIVDGGSMMN